MSTISTRVKTFQPRNIFYIWNCERGIFRLGESKSRVAVIEKKKQRSDGWNDKGAKMPSADFRADEKFLAVISSQRERNWFKLSWRMTNETCGLQLSRDDPEVAKMI